MVCDLTPRPGELWQSTTTAHAWLVRVLNVSLNTVSYTQIAGPARRRGQVHRMSLAAFQRCFSGENSPPVESPCVCSDYDADGDADLADYSKLIDSYLVP